jgi:SAM-dependent methyltransferase
MALAPNGDPRRVNAHLDPGVKFQLHYPLPSPGGPEYYWYWPNAENIAFKIDIDLAASKATTNAIRIYFSFDMPDVKLAHIKNSFYIPVDLRKYFNFPDQDKLSRVQMAETIGGVLVRGYSDYKRLRVLSETYGSDLRTAKILDWGCGHGRVIRHFEDIGPGVELHAIDIDPDNIQWALENLPSISFTRGPLMPPLQVSENTFDLVFGVSVMTHLTPAVQNAWLSELQRILKPGGLALLTFAGDTNVAFVSRIIDQKWLSEYIETGSGRDLPSTDLEGIIDQPGYYMNVYNTARVVRSRCSEYFEVLDILECMFGYQDLAVLRKK